MSWNGDRVNCANMLWCVLQNSDVFASTNKCLQRRSCEGVFDPHWKPEVLTFGYISYWFDGEDLYCHGKPSFWQPGVQNHETHDNNRACFTQFETLGCFSKGFYNTYDKYRMSSRDLHCCLGFLHSNLNRLLTEKMLQNLPFTWDTWVMFERWNDFFISLNTFLKNYPKCPKLSQISHIIAVPFSQVSPPRLWAYQFKEDVQFVSVPTVSTVIRVGFLFTVNSYYPTTDVWYDTQKESAHL